MPIMPRPNKKAEKIAFDILGIPQNMRKPVKKVKQTKKESLRAYVME
jgi:hypothetical protein